MFEKVNPMHPDKVADRIAGALVDLAYKKAENPKIAVEVLIGHGKAFIITETSEKLDKYEVCKAVQRISGISNTTYIEVPQDAHLASNQAGKIRCGDNGIFKGCPVSDEQWLLQDIATVLYQNFRSDGKFILNGEYLIICQSGVKNNEVIRKLLLDLYNRYEPDDIFNTKINPLGPWTGGLDVDCGATNRKLGSDMGDAVTGGGLHGKDLSKSDVSVNIYCHIMAQKTGREYKVCCAIGDTLVDGRPYAEIVEIARQYIKSIGGFEKFAEWGLIR